MNTQIVRDGWQFLFESLSFANDGQSQSWTDGTELALEGLDNLQREFWDTENQSSLEPLAVVVEFLLSPLVAVKIAFSPYIVPEEAAAWDAWAAAVDDAVALAASDAYSESERATLIVAWVLHGIRGIEPVSQTLPLVTTPFALLRTSKAWLVTERRRRIVAALENSLLFELAVDAAAALNRAASATGNAVGKAVAAIIAVVAAIGITTVIVRGRTR